MQIYFDTATFDNIERDKAVKFEAQLGLVGGTMGLLTGFSIISGIEIIFFLVRLTLPSSFCFDSSLYFRLVSSFHIRKITRENIVSALQLRRRFNFKI